MRVIATDKSGYATERNISGLPFQHYRVRRAPNLYRLPNYLHFRATGNAHARWSNLHRDLGLGGYDLLHLFNGVSRGRKPWVSTFETFLPRWGAYGDDNLKIGLAAMAQPQCKSLIALSDCARRIQIDLLDQYPAYREAILPKLKVLHPPQAAFIEDCSEKPLSEDFIDLVLVGNLFFLKGGLEVLRVVDILLKEGAPLRLHIVSSLESGDHATLSGTKELTWARRLLKAHPKRILHYTGLPNSEVMQLFQRSHIGLLPTWADTYGYSVLEAQAAGCPVISTNVRALPEINPPEAGWIAQVPLNPLGYAKIQSKDERDTFSTKLMDELESILRGVLASPKAIQEKGEKALARIKAEHSATSRAAWLENLYNDILGS